jgi:hypothetical protein
MLGGRSSDVKIARGSLRPDATDELVGVGLAP